MRLLVLTENILCNPKLFADDVSLNAVMNDSNVIRNLNADLDYV